LNDLDSLVHPANNWNIAKNLTDQFSYPYTEAHGKAFIEMATKDHPVHIFAIEVDGKAYGAIGINEQEDIHRRNAELGYWLAEHFWGQGIISSAIKEVVEIAFSIYEIDRIFARPFGTNRASQKVLEKNGFVLEGRFEKNLIKSEILQDELIYAIRRENRTEK